MSRLYGRIEDVRSISDYLKENYNGIYTPDKTIIKDSELEHAPNVIESYLTKDIVFSESKFIIPPAFSSL